MLGHGARITIGPVRISLQSWWRLLVWMAAVLAVRHYLWPSDPWPFRIVGWLRAGVRADAFRAAWPPFVVSRVVALTVGYLAVIMIGFSPPRPFRALDNDVLDLFARWDAGWYFGIASVGYRAGPDFSPTSQNGIAFFPALPMMMRYTALLLSVNRWVAGIIIVLGCFFWGLICLYKLAREDLSDDQARAALLFLAFYPFAVCYSAVLTESMFLMAAAGSFLYLRRGELLKAAPFALLAGLVRPNGFLLCVPLALIVILPFARGRGWIPWGAPGADLRWRSVAVRCAVAALPVVGMLGYSAYVYSLTGDPFAWAKAQQAWGRSSALILQIFRQRIDLISTYGWGVYGRYEPRELLETAAVVLGLVAVWPVTRRFGLAYGLFVAMAILPPYITMGSVSLGRYTAPLFPIFLWLGAAVPERRRPYWIAAFAAGQAFVAVLFYTWRPPY